MKFNQFIIVLAFISTQAQASFDASSLIQGSLQTAERLIQIESSIQKFEKEIDKLKDERGNLEKINKLDGEDFFSILTQHSGIVGSCELRVERTLLGLTSLFIKRKDGLSTTALYSSKNIKKADYKVVGRITNDKQLVYLTAESLNDEVDGKETRIMLILNQSNQIENLRINIELKGKNFDSKECK